MTKAPAFPASIDPVRFEVVRNALLAITEEMGATLRRAAYSTNIKTRADFSCAFFDRNLRTIAQAFAQPSHLGSLAHIVPHAVREYGADRLQPGDGILINDPYRGGVHLNDITLITPVFEGRTPVRLRGQYRPSRRCRGRVSGQHRDLERGLPGGDGDSPGTVRPGRSNQPRLVRRHPLQLSRNAGDFG